MEQRRILVKQIITELNEIVSKIQFTDAELAEFNRVNNSNYSKQNLTSILKQALKDFEKRLREDIANNNQIIDFEKEFMEALHKLGITGEAAKLFLKSKLGALSRFVFQKKYEALNAKREQNEISRMESVRAADKKQEKIEQKQEKVEQEQEKVEQEQEKVEQEQEKAVQKQRDLETEAKTEIAAEAQVDDVDRILAATIVQQEEKKQVDADTKNLQEQHPLREFLDSFSSESSDRWYNDAEFRNKLWQEGVSRLKKLPPEEREKAEAEVVHNLKEHTLLDSVNSHSYVISAFNTAFDKTLKSMAKEEDKAEVSAEQEIMSFFKDELAKLAEDIGWDEEQQKEITKQVKEQLQSASSDNPETVKKKLGEFFDEIGAVLITSDPESGTDIFIGEFNEQLNSHADHPQP